jgi:hypothetical protein
MRLVNLLTIFSLRVFRTLGLRPSKHQDCSEVRSNMVQVLQTVFCLESVHEITQ